MHKENNYSEIPVWFWNNLRLQKSHKTQKPINPFPNKPWFLWDCSTSLMKTLELLKTSNF